MLVELKRCNSIGNLAGITFLVSVLSGKAKINKHEVANRATLENNITLNCSGAIAFFEYLGFVEVNGDEIITTEKFSWTMTSTTDEIVKDLVKACITKIAEEGLLDNAETSFDAESGNLSIKRSVFPLSHAAIRNFLTMVGVLSKEENGEIGVNENYESEFSSFLRNRNKKLSLEQLLANQAAQSQRGLEAEEFVLSLEKEYLPEKKSRIKRISDFDVSAGYDIVSFQSADSVKYDKFIEVKCYIGTPHFYWSENEIDVAKLKGENYCLCLVDYEKINQAGYLPEYIPNPYPVIFGESDWFVNAASYKVQKIQDIL